MKHIPIQYSAALLTGSLLLTTAPAFAADVEMTGARRHGGGVQISWSGPGPEPAVSNCTAFVDGENATANTLVWTFDINTDFALNIQIDDNNYATTAGGSADPLIFTDFDLDLPDNAIIESIFIDAKGRGSTGAPATKRNWRLALTKNGSTPATAWENAAWPDLPFDVNTTLSAGDGTWGLSWTAAELNSPNFGVMIADNDLATADG
ncbi:MAG: hypothetical protein AAF492_16655, partial [Verrucomicrobiota bacterium]